MKYKAEIFDKLQYLYEVTGFNDHQVHCVIDLENNLDESVMKEAASLLVSVVPILARVYKNEGRNSYWEDVDSTDGKDLFTIVYKQEDFDRFTFSKTNEEAGPQIKICLLRSDRDSLSIVMNHMVSDGGGFKQCVYLLADIYTNLIRDPDYKPDYIIDGERSFKRIIKKIGYFSRLKILLFGRKDNNQSSECEFSLSQSKEVSPFIVTHEVEATIFRKIRNRCKSDNVTVNDVILTAYFRTLSEFMNMNGREFDIPNMIDMRKYLENKNFTALANLASTVIVRIAVTEGERFSQTLHKVNGLMNEKKSDYLGINTFLKLYLLQKIFHNKYYSVLQKGLKNPKICMTNLGIIDSKKLLFQNSPTTNAIMCGSIKYRPHFQMSLSTFNDRMTLCVNLYGDKSDYNTISNFLASVDNELKSFADSSRQ
ncbi:MAG: hypothetical protein HY818_14100 [Acetobacterium woodii]|nr:hypothetical protein [Acetobacterium woodii]